MNANEARTLTNQAVDVNGNYMRKQLDEILMQVKHAAAEGKDRIFTGTLAPINVTRLKTLGYAVTVDNNQRDPGAQIKW